MLIAFWLFCTICLHPAAAVIATAGNKTDNELTSKREQQKDDPNSVDQLKENPKNKQQGHILFKMTNFKAFSEGRGPTEESSDKVFINGMPWIIRIKPNGIYVAFDLCNGSDQNDFAWACQVAQRLLVVSYDNSVKFLKGSLSEYRLFHAQMACSGYYKFARFENLMDPKNGVYDEKEDTITFKVEVIAEDPYRTLDVRAENALLVNEKIVYVNKYILAAQSEFFKKIFFEEEKVTKKIQIEATEKPVENFEHLISFVNSPNAELEDDSVEDVLQLANLFQMNSVAINKRRGQIVFKMPNFKAFSKGDGPNEVYSDNVYIYGSQWNILIEYNEQFLSFYWHYNYGNEIDSSLVYNVSYQLSVVSATQCNKYVLRDDQKFNATSDFSWGYDQFEEFEKLMDPRNGLYDEKEDIMTFRAEIIVNEEREPPYHAYTFSADDTLLINDDRQIIKVNKYLLAAHSEKFRKLFFGEEKATKIMSNFNTLTAQIAKNENSVEYLKKLIFFVNSPNAELNDECVEIVLLLATDFQMDSIVNRCVSFLMNKSKKALINKFALAHQYKIIGMKNKIMADIKEKKSIQVKQYMKDILFLLENAVDDNKALDEEKETPKEHLGSKKVTSFSENDKNLEQGQILFKMTNFKAFSEGRGPDKIQSRRVLINGMPWKIQLKPNGIYVAFYLRIDCCKYDFAWTLQAAHQLSIVSSTKGDTFVKGNLNDFQIYHAKKNTEYDHFATFEELMDPGKGVYDGKEDAVTFKAEVVAEQPNRSIILRPGDDTLFVNDQLVYVNKYLLAAHSKGFKELFFENGNTQVLDKVDNVETFKKLITCMNSPNALGFEEDEQSFVDSDRRINWLASSFGMKTLESSYKKVYQIVFKMPEFKAFSKGDGPTEVYSDDLSFNGLWTIWIKHNGNFVEYYLCNYGSEGSYAKINKVSFKLFVVPLSKQNHSFVKGHFDNFKLFKSNGVCKGYDKFTTFEKLMDPRNGLYDEENDTMTFKAQFIICQKLAVFNAYGADDTLLVNKQEVKVNKYILAVHSPIFRKVFFEQKSEEEGKLLKNSKMPEIQLDFLENAVANFEQFFSFISCADNELDDDAVEMILLLANHFQMDSFVNRCVSFLTNESKKAQINQFILAHKYNIIGMKMKILADMTEKKSVKSDEYIKDISFLLDMPKQSNTEALKELKEYLKKQLVDME